jgi:hypothetical protein
MEHDTPPDDVPPEPPTPASDMPSEQSRSKEPRAEEPRPEEQPFAPVEREEVPPASEAPPPGAPASPATPPVSDAPPLGGPPAKSGPPTKRYVLTVALLIVVASLAGAGVAWSASVSSTKASDLDQLAQQQFLEQQQILTSGGADVAEELRRVGTFQQQIASQRYFAEQAQALAAKYPQLAAQFASEAQGQSALARNTAALFFATFPQISPDGTVTYDRQQALNNLLGRYVIYQQLHPEQIQAQAADEHTKAGRIVGVGIILVAALFFLTLAQVARSRTRHGFLVVGTAILIAGLVLWVVVAL